ncbi:hypothetical protein HAX54_026144 [Datura stramonium]|uniref:Uncharacterized protein n=1 Tax=Datura stramonium TaxID=4076 RepID=A0ABS8V2W5_DATST|nr:hypothetical protein [Datura stramonium]
MVEEKRERKKREDRGVHPLLKTISEATGEEMVVRLGEEKGRRERAALLHVVGENGEENPGYEEKGEERDPTAAAGRAPIRGGEATVDIGGFGYVSLSDPPPVREAFPCGEGREEERAADLRPGKGKRETRPAAPVFGEDSKHPAD